MAIYQRRSDRKRNLIAAKVHINLAPRPKRHLALALALHLLGAGPARELARVDCLLGAYFRFDQRARCRLRPAYQSLRPAAISDGSKRHPRQVKVLTPKCPIRSILR